MRCRVGRLRRRWNLSSNDRYSDRKVWRKLVRDRIPEIISKDGKIAVTRTLTNSDFRLALLDKLHEESLEARGSSDDEELSKELSDVLEVVHALAEIAGIPWDSLEQLRERRALERGAFKQQIWLEETYPKSKRL